MKDTYYTDLMEMMNGKICPICVLIEKKTLRQLDYLLYENVNDHGVRSDFSSSNGFCMHHATVMLSLGDPLGHAILYEDLLQKMLNELKHDNLTDFQSKCTLCDSELFNETNLIKSFMNNYQEEEEFKQRYLENGLLCLYHLNQIKLSNIRDSNHDFTNLLEVSMRKYESLLHDLSEIKRKNDYRYADESWTDGEKNAWKKVVQLTIDQGKHRR